jgi:hypothetical protein
MTDEIALQGGGDYERGHARLNRSEAALIRRGIDSGAARRLVSGGMTLQMLQQHSDDVLATLGCSASQVKALRSGGRPEIPQANLSQVLWANRFTCCICRDSSLAYIVHHIMPWAESHDHGVGNLAVLCLEHHARAHRTGTLEQNLGPTQLRSAKERWEESVGMLDTTAILAASRVAGSHWWWFNHVRIFDLAETLGVPLAQVEGFLMAHRAGMVNDTGYLEDIGSQSCYRYEGGAGNHLYRYVRNLLEHALAQTAVFDISNDLDAGFLHEVVHPGDLVLVQGRHQFRRLNTNDRGPGQSCRGVRQANGVRVAFTIDLWEAVSNSTWSGWLAGTTNVTSLLRVGQIFHKDGRLVLQCTAFAIGNLLAAFRTRSYSNPTWPVQEEDDIDDDVFLS